MLRVDALEQESHRLASASVEMTAPLEQGLEELPQCVHDSVPGRRGQLMRLLMVPAGSDGREKEGLRWWPCHGCLPSTTFGPEGVVARDH